MNKNIIKPYGDTLNDGIIQLSFTLPVKSSAKAKSAAFSYVEHLNCSEIDIVHQEAIAGNFTYFVAYAKANPTINYDLIKANEIVVEELDFYEINKLIKSKLNRKLKVIGATIGSDAHTVGIDAIMNMKGFNGNYGLERYPEITAINLGSQISAETLLEQSLKSDSDAILVSQTVTQKDSHIKNFTEFIELLEAENLRSNFLVIAGGPRISHDLAIELGYDAGFGANTTPSQVASYIINELTKTTTEIQKG